MGDQCPRWLVTWCHIIAQAGQATAMCHIDTCDKCHMTAFAATTDALWRRRASGRCHESMEGCVPSALDCGFLQPAVVAVAQEVVKLKAAREVAQPGNGGSAVGWLTAAVRTARRRRGGWGGARSVTRSQAYGTLWQAGGVVVLVQCVARAAMRAVTQDSSGSEGSGAGSDKRCDGVVKCCCCCGKFQIV